MGRLVMATAAALLLGGATLLSDSSAQGRGKAHKGGRDGARHDTSRDATGAVRVVFASGEVTLLRTHYAPRYRNLPPGLQKKVARGGQLPPGWQKKFEPFPATVERRLAPLPQGYRRGVIDGHAVIYNPRTNVIIDVAVLF